MTTRTRSGFTLFQLLLVIALLALLFAMFLPAILRARKAALDSQRMNNLKQIALGVHNYASAYGDLLPVGVDDNHFSVAARVLPFIEQDNLFKLLDFKKPIDDPANATARAVLIKTYLSQTDPQGMIDRDYGPTNYLFNAGTKYDLKDNDGLFYLDSKLKIGAIPDGTSNTIMAGETLKGDGSDRAADVRRQHVLLGEGDLKTLKDESGVQEFKDGKKIAGNRCSRWVDGRFLQGTFNAARVPNDERPDVSCAGLGGLSGLRSLDSFVVVGMADGSVRLVNAKVKAEVWKAAMGRNDGLALPPDF